MTVWKWSPVAATNATADSTINWQEGQAPSSVNDSGRGMMAAISKYRDDIAGNLVTSGSSIAYVLASNQIFDTLAHLDKNQLAFVPHLTNGAGSPSVTLNVDSTGAKPIRVAPGVELPPGTLVQGTPYRLTYNNADAVFYLQDFFNNPYNIPLGGMMPYTGGSAPNSSFVFPFGQAISRTTYASYFTLVGSTYGVGDGFTTFNVIDLRGRVVAGQDNMGGTPAGRIGTSLVTDGGTINGSFIGSVGGSATHALTATEQASMSVTASGSMSGTMTGAISAIATTSGQICASGANFGVPSNPTSIPVSVSGTVSGSVSGTATGGAVAHSMLQPTVVIPYILRVI